MKYIMVVVFLILNTGTVHGNDKAQTLIISCEDYRWSDIEFIVQDYLDDMLYAALVMQGQSSDYRTSSAAMQALATPEYFPADVKLELQAIVDADC